MTLYAAHMRPHVATKRGEMRADVSRSQYEHVGSFERADCPQVFPLMSALQIEVAGQALDQAEQHGKHVLAHRLTVRSHRACESSVCGDGACRNVVVVAGRLQLQQLQMFAGTEQSRVDVSENDVGSRRLLSRYRGSRGVDEFCSRRARFQQSSMLGLNRQKYQYVHVRYPFLSIYYDSAKGCSEVDGVQRMSLALTKSRPGIDAEGGRDRMS